MIMCAITAEATSNIITMNRVFKLTIYTPIAASRKQRVYEVNKLIVKNFFVLNCSAPAAYEIISEGLYGKILSQSIADSCARILSEMCFTCFFSKNPLEYLLICLPKK